jgi:hypothetical protein
MNVNTHLNEYLKAMGHHDLQFLPSDKICDYFLPSVNTAIILRGKNLTSLATNDISSTGKFCQDVLKSQGVNAVILDSEVLLDIVYKEKGHSEFVNYLTSHSKYKIYLDVQNKAADSIDFSGLERLEGNRREQRREPETKKNKTAEEEDEE